MTTPVRLINTSHSIDNVFDYCPRKFEFLNLYDRRPERDSGFAAQVGTALHNGLQAWMIARAEGDDKDSAEAKGYKALFLDYPWNMEREQKTQQRDSWKTIALLEQMFQSREWNDWELMRLDNGKWAVEVPFLIKHVGVGEFTIHATGERALLTTQGKIDFIFRHKHTGKIRTWDLKTTIKPSEMIRSEYTFSGQQVGYSHVLHAMLGEAPQNFTVWYLIARFGGTGPGEVISIEIPKGQDIIDDYWIDKMDRLRRMREFAECGRFPRTNGGCNSWGSECFFFDVCHERDDEFVKRWFDNIDAEPQVGYVPWVTMEV